MLSRVADSLYWMSRYLERAEHTARLLDLGLHTMLDQSSSSADQRWQRLLSSLYVEVSPGQTTDAYAITQMLTFDQSNSASIVSCLASARENARHAREQISSEMWEQLNRLFLQLKRTTVDDIWQSQPHEFYQAVKEGAQLFQGITDSTMSHGEGWHFIHVGRYIERASAVTALLQANTGILESANESQTDRAIELVSLLKSCTAYEAYCQVYTAEVRPEWTLEYLLLNAEFPHSVRFSVEMVQTALSAIAQSTGAAKTGRISRLAGRLLASLSFGQVDEILSGGLHDYLDEIRLQCAQLHSTIYQVYVSYPIESALAS